MALFSGEMDEERLMERALAIEGRATVDELRSACYPNGLVPPANLCSSQGVCMGQIMPVNCTGATGWMS